MRGISNAKDKMVGVSNCLVKAIKLLTATEVASTLNCMTVIVQAPPPKIILQPFTVSRLCSWLSS